MALLQISEPGLSAAPHQRRLAAGIDLGTTNSLVATVRSGQAETLADSAGRTMGDIVASVKQVTEIMNDITAASQRQSKGIEEVNNAITEMDELTQRNAALVEQSAAAAQSMQDQAQRLADAVSIFKLGSEGDALVASVAVSAAPGPAPRAALKVAKVEARVVAQAPAAKRVTPPPAKKLAAASGDDWEEF